MSPWLDFVSPVPRPSQVTQGWGAPREAIVGGQHRGLDFHAPVGTPVYAAGPGVVEFARNTPESTAGRWVGIRHVGGLLTRYLHFSQILVKQGQTVTAGQQIGVSGNTGYTAGPHLHFDAIVPDKTTLNIYTSLFGAPRGGVGDKSDFGYKVPAEPLIPADSYAPEVVAGAKSFGFPLYANVPARSAESGNLVALLVLGPFYAIPRLLRRA